MKPTTKAILIFLAIALLIIGVGTLVTRCSKQKSDVVKKHTDNLNAISTKYAFDSLKYIRQNDSLKLVSAKKDKSYDSLTVLYRLSKSRVAKAEKIFIEVPTLENCHHLVNEQRTALRECEHKDSLNVERVKDRDNQLKLADNFRLQQDSTIQSLKAGYSTAISDLEKASKPKRIVGSIGLGYGITGNRLQPYAGVQIGYKLFQF